MIIKKAKYKKVKVIQRRMISDAVHGCDCCKKEINNYPNEVSRLEVTVFQKDGLSDTEHLHFCSWACVLKHLPIIKSNYFVSLPHLYYDEGKGQRTVTELLKLLNPKTKKK
jgi:hypothetical protein